MLNKYQENVIKYSNVMRTSEEIAKLMKVEKSKIELTILTLARKNHISKDKATKLIDNKNLLKLLNEPINTRLKNTNYKTNEKIKSITI